MKENGKESFTDGSFVPSSEVPNTPKIYTNAVEENRSRVKAAETPVPADSSGRLRSFRVLCACIVCLLIGDVLGLLAAERGFSIHRPEPGITVVSPSPDVIVASADRRKTTDGPRLGITAQTVTPAAAQYYGISTGVCVMELEEESPAALAGLKKGDVIIAFDSRNVTTADEIKELLDKLPAGPVSLTAVRSGETLSLTAELP